MLPLVQVAGVAHNPRGEEGPSGEEKPLRKGGVVSALPLRPGNNPLRLAGEAGRAQVLPQALSECPEGVGGEAAVEISLEALGGRGNLES